MRGHTAIHSAAKYALPVALGFTWVAVAQQQPPAQNQAGQAKPKVFAVGRLGDEPPEEHRPPLFFREEWKRMPKDEEHPLTQTDLVNQDLEVKTYGDQTGILEVQHSRPVGEPTMAWTGLCKANCALALRDKNNYVDLTGYAKIKWQNKQSGFHLLRPIIKLADGTWLVGDHADADSVDWRVSEMTVPDIRWRKLDINQVTEANNGAIWIDHPDLTKVDEIGFTDLMRGTGHGGGGASRVAWIEVYGNPVPRSTQQSSAK
jgi:hypothetical protein